MATATVLPFVRGVDLAKYDFEGGSFDDRLYNMKNLKWLSLNKSKVSALPEDLEKFPKLESLSASKNEVKELYSCNIPSCSNLRILGVHHNNLRESGIPTDLFNLENLVTLDFSHNEFSKLPDQLTNAKRLLVLNLGHNRLTQIPGALFVHCRDLFYLDLGNNQITALPPQLRRLEHLQTLILANNPLQHYVFKNIDKLKSLTTLNLSNTGRDLTNTQNLHMLRNLTDVDFSHNNLQRVPDGLLMLESLRRVDMSHNQIKELSSLVGSWTELITLNLSYNKLKSLPADICHCVKLRRMYLSDNELTFEGLPTNIGKLEKLEHFIAPRNSLECIPEGFGRCYKLKRLILTSNRLLTLPDGLYYLSDLKEILTDLNPDLVMPPKPTDEVEGSGEFYNIDFNAEILKAGAAVATGKSAVSSYRRKKERIERMARRRTTSVESDASADKVLKGLVRVADTKHQREVEMIKEEPEEEEVENIKARSWREALKRPDLNYKDLFPGEPGKVPGLILWQIENFYPVQVDETFHGKFYTGDCYIVLRTSFDEKSKLDWVIWYWIGNDTTIDKKTCVAMHAIHLRNMLEATCSTIREEQGDESFEFLEVFSNDVQYIEGGTASGFYSVEENAPPVKMYRVHQVKTLHLELVLPAVQTLDQGFAFIVDAGKEIFVWHGVKSTLNARSKARLVAEKISKTERKNQANITSFKHGLETDEFWAALGSPPKDAIGRDLALKDFTPMQSTLFKVKMGNGYLELPQVEIPDRSLKSSLLKEKKVYILDCGPDIFVWIGRKSPRLVRAAAMRLSGELFLLINRPQCAQVTKVLQGTEPVVFKSKFEGWDDVLSVNFNRQGGKDKKGGPVTAPKVDVSPLFKARKESMLNRVAHGLMDKYNAPLKQMQGYILEGKKFVELPKKEKGHFYTQDCYVFLCRYEYASEEKEGEDNEDEEEPDVYTHLYFWQGRDASNLGWLTFKFDFLKKIEPLLMDGKWDYQRVHQQQEDIEFLSHFGGKFIIHWGRRQEKIKVDEFSPCLYQIRANNSKICRRVVQVEAKAKSLNSAFCYVLKVPFENTGGAGIVYVWAGNKTIQEEQINAEQMGRTMFEVSYSNQTIYEGAEPENFFWVAMGGKGPHDTEAEYMKHVRLFKCSNDQGFFAITERLADFCQDDLQDDDVMILDTGLEIFLWFGRTSSEMEKKLALKSAQVYRKFLSERKIGDVRKIRLAKKGSEPHEFTRCFHGWVLWRKK